ncbi:MAG: tail fiber domain-containing protein [Patescibacteria group bacterium]
MACFAVFSLFFVVSQANASFNQQINYQGKLTDHSDSPVADGDYDMVFRLCADSSCSSVLWTETRTGADQVAVANGLFSVMLGSVTSLSSVDFNQDIYLEVAVDGETLTPRKRLGAVPNALNTLEFDGLATTSFLRADMANDRATITNLTSTNFFASNASITNATSTNFFAAALSAISSIISSLTATIANISTLVFGDATGGTLAVTDLSVTSTANIKNLSASSTLAINATSTNLFSTYASITQATTTDFYTSVFNAISGLFTNLVATIASITDLTATRATSTESFASQGITTLATTTFSFFNDTVQGKIYGYTIPSGAFASGTNVILTDVFGFKDSSYIWNTQPDQSPMILFGSYDNDSIATIGYQTTTQHLIFVSNNSVGAAKDFEKISLASGNLINVSISQNPKLTFSANSVTTSDIYLNSSTDRLIFENASGGYYFDNHVTTTGNLGVLGNTQLAATTINGNLSVTGSATTTNSSYLGTVAGLNGVYINDWSDISTLAGNWSTSSSDYWKSITNFFSTTSADYWETQQIRWSTTSEQYFWNTTTTWAGFQSNFDASYLVATAKNPFDQWLDTTNTPTFAGLDLTGELSVSGTSTLATTTINRLLSGDQTLVGAGSAFSVSALYNLFSSLFGGITGLLNNIEESSWLDYGGGTSIGLGSVYSSVNVNSSSTNDSSIYYGNNWETTYANNSGFTVADSNRFKTLFDAGSNISTNGYIDNVNFELENDGIFTGRLDNVHIINTNDGGTITGDYSALRIDDVLLMGATNNYAIYSTNGKNYFGGDLRVVGVVTTSDLYADRISILDDIATIQETSTDPWGNSNAGALGITGATNYNFDRGLNVNGTTTLKGSNQVLRVVTNQDYYQYGSHQIEFESYLNTPTDSIIVATMGMTTRIPSDFNGDLYRVHGAEIGVINDGTTTDNRLIGSRNYVYDNGAGIVDQIWGSYGEAGVSNGGQTLTISEFSAFHGRNNFFDVINASNTTITVTDAIGLDLDIISDVNFHPINYKGINIRNVGNDGAENAYGFYTEGITSASNLNYNIWSGGSNTQNYFAGKVGIGKSLPETALDVYGTVSTTLLTINGNASSSASIYAKSFRASETSTLATTTINQLLVGDQTLVGAGSVISAFPFYNVLASIFGGLNAFVRTVEENNWADIGGGLSLGLGSIYSSVTVNSSSTNDASVYYGNNWETTYANNSGFLVADSNRFRTVFDVDSNISTNGYVDNANFELENDGIFTGILDNVHIISTNDGGTITGDYSALRIDDVDSMGATNNYAIYSTNGKNYFGGDLQVAGITTTTNLVVGSLNGILQATNGLVGVTSSPYLSGDLTIGSLNGVLQATNGLVGVTSSPYLSNLKIATSTLLYSAPSYVTTSLPEVHGGASNSMVYGDYLYVVLQSPTSTNKLRIFDISNPDNPIIVNDSFALRPGAGLGARCIDIDGKYAYIGFEEYSYQSTNTLSILDISDPTNPVEKVGEDYIANYALRKLKVIDGLLYTAYYSSLLTGEDGLQIINVSNPSKPRRISNPVTNFPGETRGIDVQGKYAYTVSYVATSTNVFRIVDISDPVNPIVVGGDLLDMPPLGRDVVVKGSYAYTTHDCFGPPIDIGVTSTEVFRIIDISSSTNPVIVGGSQLEFYKDINDFSGSTGLSVQGDYAYVVDNKGAALKIINISDPYNPYFVDSISTLGNPWGVEVSGNRAYLPLSVSPNRLVIIKLPGLDTPTARVGSLVSGGLQVLRDLITVGLGKFFGVIIGSGGLKVAGETNLNSTTTIGVVTTTPTHKLTVTSPNDWLQLTNDGNYGLKFYINKGLMDVPMISGHASTSAVFGSDMDLVGIKDHLAVFSTNRDAHVSFFASDFSSAADIYFTTSTELLSFDSAKSYQWLDYNDGLPFVTFDAEAKTVNISTLDTNGAVYSNNGTLTNVNPSSREYKDDIIDTSLNIDALLGLQVKSFIWKQTGQTDFGLIAEEIRDALPELYLDDGRTKGYRADHLPFYLLQVAQRQEQELGVLSAQLSGIIASSTESALVVDDSPLDDLEVLDSLAVNSSATFYGTITVIGEAGFESKVVFKDHIYLDKDAAGTVKLSAGATSTAVHFAKPYDVDPIITLTPLLNVSGHDYWIEAQSSTGFIVAVDLPFTEEMRFNWHALAVKSDDETSDNNTDDLGDIVVNDEMNIVLSSSSPIFLQNNSSTTADSSGSDPFFVSSTPLSVTGVIGPPVVLGANGTAGSKGMGTIQPANPMAGEPSNPEIMSVIGELTATGSGQIGNGSTTVTVAAAPQIDLGNEE